MTIQTLAVWRTQRGCENLIASASAMPEDRRSWRPLGSGQAVNDLLGECALVNLKWAATLRNRVYTQLSPDVEEPIRAAIRAGEGLTDCLSRSASELIAAIQSVRDDELTALLETPFGVYTLADCCLIAYWNSVYHEGQINYIQTLSGDQARHTAF